VEQTTQAPETVTLKVKNIGGITETSVTLTLGVNILTGHNATNRTSLLQAIQAVLGSERASIKGDADKGHVELSIGGTTYTRRLQRTNEAVVIEGDPYLEDAMLADLFAFLLESNEARQAVRRDDNLREVIMEPIDTGDIERQIDQLRTQRDNIDAQIDEINREKQKLQDLEEERTRIQDNISDKRKELSDLKDDIADIDQDIDEKRSKKEKLDKLNDTRSELESVRHQIDTQNKSLEALREEREELEIEQEEYEEIPDGRLDSIQSEIQRLHNRKDELNATINELQTVIEFNENLLDGDLDIFDDLDEGDAGGDVTDQLLDDEDDLTCWTCGSQTTTDQIESMAAKLRELRDQYRDERRDIDADMNDLNEDRRQLEEKRRQRRQIDDRLETVSDEIEHRKGRIEELKERRSDLTEEVETLEATVESLQAEDEQDSELLDLHKEANRLEVEIDRLESNLDHVEDDIEEIETAANQRSELQSRRDEIETEIEDLRTRVERLEQDAVLQFNDHMESVLDLLNYDNLERIWIERTEEQVRQGRQTVTQGRFDLHIVRSTDSGTVYEDTVGHLSESEREVTGLVFALAGYLVHDVHETVPFMLMDSVEAIDAPRLAELVDYFESHANYLTVALLEEDAQALDDGYHRVSDI